MNNHAHDALFRDTFSRRDAVETFIQKFLPAPLASAIDLATLEHVNESFLDENLERHFADSIWTCRLKNDSQLALALLLEHKSVYDRRTILQVFRYDSLFQEFLEREQKAAMPVFPCVVYHGRRRWKVTSFVQFFDKMPAILRPFFPNYFFHLVDLSQLSADEIIDLEGTSLVNGFFLLRFGRDKKGMQAQFEKLANFVERIGDSDIRRRAISVMLEYLSSNGWQNDEVMENVKKTRLTLHEVYLQYGEPARQFKKGEQKGLEKGRQEAREEATNEFVRLLFERGMTVDEIVETIRLPKADILDRLAKMALPEAEKK